ncbi:hypothetical protein [Pseudomarimonas arenosa]|uniref:Uncharacterized protein n=1 Tax=Pseudomarimonas arenosa TaxID=2774145 RepID=A0AAW3ZP01_9GAMM|nr:hypothetical protein [Pseudomarimonas arenosa]MBD8527453.1 hypothetical protein [Pseudomarimonas arenosa]
MTSNAPAPRPEAVAFKEFDRLAQESNGDPIPRPLWLNLRLDQWSLSGNGLDLLLLEAERLGKRFDRDRDVLGICCRCEQLPPWDDFNSLIDSLSRRFHFSVRPPAEKLLQVAQPGSDQARSLWQQQGWKLELAPPWFEPGESSRCDVLPLGPAARASLGGIRFENEADPDTYRAALQAGRLAIARRLHGSAAPIAYVPAWR